MTDEETGAPLEEPKELSNDPFADVRRSLEELAAAVQTLGTQCGRDHDRAVVREKVIDRLHEDNQRLRAGDRRLLLQPLLVDLQRLRHELLRESARLPELMPGRQVADMLRSFAYTLELTLGRGGIEVMAPSVGSSVDPARQRVTATLETAERVLDATVANVIIDGYFDTVAGRVTSPAEVHVHRWTAQIVSQQPETATEPPTEPALETALETAIEKAAEPSYQGDHR